METLALLLTLSLIIAWLITLKVAINQKEKLQAFEREKAELKEKIAYLEQQLELQIKHSK